jgi:hypothetical protein
MRQWMIPAVALVMAMAVGSSAYGQAPSGSGDKMDKGKMMDKTDDKMGGKMDKDKMMDKKDDKMGGKMDKDKMMDKKDDKMMDKKQ